MNCSLVVVDGCVGDYSMKDKQEIGKNTSETFA